MREPAGEIIGFSLSFLLLSNLLCASREMRLNVSSHS